MPYRLLEAFKGLFSGQAYLHRRSNLGDSVAIHFYEDLYDLNRSARYVARVQDQDSGLNVTNKTHGVIARRGDGSFGEFVPGIKPVLVAGFSVARGPIATVEIGIEVKILSKAQGKQRDRVATDMINQVTEFRRHGGTPITVGIIGINHASVTTGYEGDRSFKTDGRTHRHPVQEAASTKVWLREKVATSYDELVFLDFNATNEGPFSFIWVDEQKTLLDYGSVLSRVGARYR